MSSAHGTEFFGEVGKERISGAVYHVRLVTSLRGADFWSCVSSAKADDSQSGKL